MSDLKRRFREDKALRDAARQVFLADLVHAKASLSGKGLAGRIMENVGEGAKDVLELAKEQADDNRGVIAGLIGALLLWVARVPIFEALFASDARDFDDPQTSEEPAEEVSASPTHSGDPDD